MTATHMTKKQEAAYCRRLNREPKAVDCNQALACPFCGEQPTAQFWHGGGPRKTMISCPGNDCDVRPMVSGSTRARALAAWNERRG